MVAIKKTKQILYDTNLVANQTRIYVARKGNAKNIGIDWKKKHSIFWSKYNIKETDFRQKTATFSSPNYFDLTTGVYCILITSPYHEDFGGEILSVEYDETTGLYNYNCQDFSRDYQSKVDIVATNIKTHRLLQHLLTKGGISLKGKIKKSQKKKYKRHLSGLRPAYQYKQGKENGSTIGFNPMTQNNNLIIRNKSYIETVRNLTFGTGAYIDTYIDKYGIIQLQPYHKNDLFNSGLYITVPEIASRNFKFDTTNIITGTIVSSTNKMKSGKYYGSQKLMNLDLRVFFGSLNNVVSNPNQAKTKQTSNKKAVTSTATEGNGTPVFMNSDNIVDKSTDRKLMEDVAGLLEKRGYKCTVGGVDPGTHYEDIDRVERNGIYFTIYGGKCAGTLKEQAESSHYWNILNERNAKMVVGFVGTRLQSDYLHRAWDDNFSPSGFDGISRPRDMLLDKGIGIAEGDNAEQLAGAFPGFKK